MAGYWPSSFFFFFFLRVSLHAAAALAVPERQSKLSSPTETTR